MGTEHQPRPTRIENPESLEQKNAEKELLFNKMYQEALARPGNLIEFGGDYTKQEFLKHIVETQDVILHGSNNQDISEFEPRQAFDSSKKSGNRTGVYGTRDEVLPMFYAIKDGKKFRGNVVSGYTGIHDENDNLIRKEYEFKVESETLAASPWSEGMVYILPKSSFEQGTDDNGNSTDEWMSELPVRPIAKLKVKPDEFPYFNEIKTIEK